MSAKFSSPSSLYFSPTLKASEKESVLQAYPRAPKDVKSPRKETVAQAVPRKSFMDTYGYDPWERSRNPIDFMKEEERIYYWVMGIDPPPELELSTDVDKAVDCCDSHCSSEQVDDLDDNSNVWFWPLSEDINSFFYSDYEDDSDDSFADLNVSAESESDASTESSELCFVNSNCENAEVAVTDAPAIVSMSKEDYIRPVDTDEVVQVVNTDEYVTTFKDVKFDVISILSYICMPLGTVYDPRESLVKSSPVYINMFVEVAASVYSVFDGDILQFRVFDPGGVYNTFKL
jgi:hypothetical protein